jgi:hypothetical protein
MSCRLFSLARSLVFQVDCIMAGKPDAKRRKNTASISETLRNSFYKADRFSGRVETVLHTITRQHPFPGSPESAWQKAWLMFRRVKTAFLCPSTQRARHKNRKNAPTKIRRD